MTTSGTTTFDLDIEEVIEEAYERCQSSTTSGYALRSARRSLNLLFLSGVIEEFIFGKLNYKQLL